MGRAGVILTGARKGAGYIDGPGDIADLAMAFCPLRKGQSLHACPNKRSPIDAGNTSSYQARGVPGR